jgi:hypothetical protein
VDTVTPLTTDNREDVPAYRRRPMIGERGEERHDIGPDKASAQQYALGLAAAYAMQRAKKGIATPENSPSLDWWCHRCYVKGQGSACWYCGRSDRLKAGAPNGAF